MLVFISLNKYTNPNPVLAYQQNMRVTYTYLKVPDVNTCNVFLVHAARTGWPMRCLISTFGSCHCIVHIIFQSYKYEW